MMSHEYVIPHICKSILWCHFRDWALEWIHSGALHALAGIASQLNAQVDATCLLLVCRAAMTILGKLPPESHHCGTLLNTMWSTIRDKGEGALATYHLMLHILELPVVRQVIQVYQHYDEHWLDSIHWCQA